MPEATIQEIELSSIKESTANPRQGFNAAKLEELAESIRERGVLQPILVRPYQDNGYQIVFGHRRLRAARLAGLKVIPAMVREMDDKAVLEAQLIENCNREDIHPLEEAEGYRQLMKLYKYSAEDLATKVGKSKAYVYARLKLSELPKEAKELFWKGRLTPATALLIARIPDKNLAVKAAKEIARDDGYGEPKGFAQAREHILRNYTLDLKSAPFPTDDPKLFEKAGSCNVCPKRTGNQKELFADVKKGDVCTDPDCFKIKSELQWVGIKNQAEEKGMKIVPEPEAKKLFPHEWSSLDSYSGFTDLHDQNYSDSKSRTWRQILGPSLSTSKTTESINAHTIEKFPVYLARDGRGRIHHMIRNSDLKLALKEVGYKSRQSVESQGSRMAQDAKKAREKSRIINDTVGRAIGKVVSQIEKIGPGVLDNKRELILLVRMQWNHLWSDTQIDICGRRKVGEDKKRFDRPQVLVKSLEDLKAGQLRALLVETIITRASAPSYRDGGGGKYGRDFMTFCKNYGADVKSLELKIARETKDRKNLRAKSSSGKKAHDGK